MISETSFKAYKGLMVYYLVEVKQDADTVVISGEKDGEVYKAEESKYTGKARTRIERAGQVSIDLEGGFRLKVSYREESTSKDEALGGVFDLKLIESGEFRGEVLSEAANSRGDCFWRLIETQNAHVAQSGHQLNRK